MRTVVKQRIMMVLALTAVPLVGSAATAGPTTDASLGRRHSLGVGAQALFVVAHSGASYDGWVGHGGGIGLYWGYRLHPRLALEVHGAYSVQDGVWENPYADVVLLHVAYLSLDGKVFLLQRGALQPFLGAGLGLGVMRGRYGDSCAHPEYAGCGGDGFVNVGPTLNAGGGLDWHLSPLLSIRTTVGYRLFALVLNSAGSEGLNQDTSFVSSISVGLDVVLSF